MADDTLELLKEVAGDEGADVSFADLLGDAAQCLDDTGKSGLAKVVRMARELVASGPQGEARIRDILTVIQEASEVIFAARSNPEAVNLDKLVAALEASAEWGLQQDARTNNAFDSVLHTLIDIRVICAQSVNVETPIEEISKLRRIDTLAGNLLDSLGLESESKGG